MDARTSMYLRGPLGCQCASTVICAIFVMVLPGALKPKRMSHLFFFAAVVVLFFPASFVSHPQR